MLLGLVVDVPALFSDKFQQSKEFYRFVPQIQFISSVWDIPVVEQSSAKLCRRREIRQVQFLVDVDAPVVVQRQGYGQTVQKTVLVRQLQFIEGRRPPFVPQREIPTVLPVQKTIETPQLQSVRWSMPLLCRSCHARCPADRCSWFRKLWRCRRCSSFAVVTSL